MPKYLYKCKVCGNECLRYKRIQNIDEPEFCHHEIYDNNGGSYPRFYPMHRLFHASFQIIAEREADKRENDLYGILTKGGDQSDRLKMMREDAAQMEKDMAAIPEEPKEWTAEDTLNTGLLQAAASGPQGIENWRKDWIKPPKEYAKDEIIGL